MGIGRCSKSAVEVPGTDFCQCRALSTAPVHVVAWLWTCQDSAVLLVSCSLPTSPAVFGVQSVDRAGCGQDVRAPAAADLPRQAVFQPHTAQALSRGSLLQQVPSEPQLHRCLSSAARASCLPSVAATLPSCALARR